MVRRVTTNGTMYNYKSTLQRTYRGLNSASEKVITNRQFNSYSEDPAAASKAFQLRRARWNTESQMDSNDRVRGKFSQGWDALEKVYNDLGNELGNYSVLRGRTDSTASGRKALGQSLISTAESIVFTMNTKYADEYIFAGADGMNAPFAWDDDGDLTFRGIKVDIDPNDPQFAGAKAEYSIDVSSVNVPANTGDPDVVLTLDGDTLNIQAGDDKDTVIKGFLDNYNANDAKEYTAKYADGKITLTAKKEAAVTTPPEATVDGAGLTVTEEVAGKDVDEEGKAKAQEANEALQKMLKETTFVDLGMGMEEGEDGKIKPDTAFNSSLCGLKFLGGTDEQIDQGREYGGYGLDKDGDPLNFISLIKKAGELLYNCDQDTGNWEEIANADDMDRIIGKLQTSLGKVSVTHVDLDTDVAFLNSNKDRLKELDDTLNNQIVGVEDMDPADAITSLMWAQYSYNAALKIGNGILSQSLLDYLS